MPKHRDEKEECLIKTTIHLRWSNQYLQKEKQSAQKQKQNEIRT